MVKYSVLGHINIDMELELESFPSPGVSIPVKSFYKHLGGCAATIALAAGNLGAEVNLFSIVGKDFPREYFRKLIAYGVNIQGVLTLDGPSPFCVILNSRKKEQGYIMYQGVAEKEELLFRQRGLFESDYLLITSGLPSFHRKVSVEVNKRGGVVIFDPSQEIHFRYTREDFIGIVNNSKYMFLNELEYRKARELTGYPPLGLSPTLKMIVVTSGGEGYRIITDEGERSWGAIPPPGEVVMPTGAGDVMRGGFLAGLEMGLNDVLAVRLGALAAAMAVTEKDINNRFPSREESMRWLRKVVREGRGGKEDKVLLKRLSEKV